MATHVNAVLVAVAVLVVVVKPVTEPVDDTVITDVPAETPLTTPAAETVATGLWPLANVDVTTTLDDAGSIATDSESVCPAITFPVDGDTVTTRNASGRTTGATVLSRRRRTPRQRWRLNK